jgi:SpoVK/Ycf46/Vps4 family AAA+-type ATPase
MYKVAKLPNNQDAQYNGLYLYAPTSKYVQIMSGDDITGPFKIIKSGFMCQDEIGIGSTFRDLIQIDTTNSYVALIDIPEPKIVYLKTMAFVIETFSSQSRKQTITVNEELLDEIKTQFSDIPMIDGCAYSLKNKYMLTPSFEPNDINSDPHNLVLLIGPDTSVHFVTKPNYILDIDLPNEQTSIFKSNFNFEEIGIGGLDKQFGIIFRRAFSSRLLPKKLIADLGINHVRGIVLHGPPGTGKTLIARQIGKILNCQEPKIVNGPSLLNKYVGESEENVRKLFADAIADTSGSRLHLIICDEFDALARKRGAGSSTSADVNDKVVNQFLSMIDGPNALNNILLICMTNRLDLIDEALLRPGRLELQIEINLPDEPGRLQILQIHTKKMGSLGYLNGVDLEQIAKQTKNFTGAELEAVVRSAVSFSVSKELDPSNLSGVSKVKPILTQEDFTRSAKEIKPQFGATSDYIDVITSKPFELYSDEYARAYNELVEKIKSLVPGNSFTGLITGPSYIGKTTLAAHVAKNTGYSCVKLISSETLVNSYSKDIDLFDKFKSGYNSDTLIVILDGVERLIEYSKVGSACAFNNKILQVIYMLMDKVVEPNKKLVVLLTSSKPELMKELDLFELCTEVYELDDWEGISRDFKSRKIST